MLKPGSRVDRYEIVEELGRGGQATVFKVRHAKLHTFHALKVLHVSSPTIIARAEQEGRIQAQLRHANVVAVTDVFEVEGRIGLLMEYVAGPSLDRWLGSRQGAGDQVGPLFDGILAGIARAHSLGLVHRDLKPANVLVGGSAGRPRAKVTDFGLAKILESEGGAGLSVTGSPMGTPQYMAPEQIRDASRVDRRADLFALGCLLYELQTGRPAYDGAHVMEVYARISSGRHASLDSLPPRIREAVAGCLAVEPEDRVGDCATLRAVLWPPRSGPPAPKVEPPAPPEVGNATPSGKLAGAPDAPSSSTLAPPRGDPSTIPTREASTSTIPPEAAPPEGAETMPPRPPSFPPGTRLADYYRVEGLVRLAEGRMYYLVDDNRPDRPHRRCWECGNEDNPPSPSASCTACGAALTVRRFLMSCRWDRESFGPYLSFFQKQISHPALLAPCDVFPEPEDVPVQLCSVVPWNNEVFLIDEAGPLPGERVVDLAQRGAGMIAMLAHHGVRLRSLQRSHFLLRPNGQPVLYDLDVLEVSEGTLPLAQTSSLLGDFRGVLRDVLPVEEAHFDAWLRAPAPPGESVADFARNFEAFRRARTPVVPTDHAVFSDLGLVRPTNEDGWRWATIHEHLEFFAVGSGTGPVRFAGHHLFWTLEGALRHRALVETGPVTAVHAFEIVLAALRALETHHADRLARVTGLCFGFRVGPTLHLAASGTAAATCWRDNPEGAPPLLLRALRERSAGSPTIHSRDLLDTSVTLTFEPGLQVLLATAGVARTVSDEDVAALLHGVPDSRLAAHRIIREAQMAEGPENITAMLLWSGGSRSAPRALRRK